MNGSALKLIRRYARAKSISPKLLIDVYKEMDHINRTKINKTMREVLKLRKERGVK